MVEYVNRAKDGRHITVNICINFRAGGLVASCGARDGAALADALEAGIAARGLDCDLRRLHCMGKCHVGPTIKLSPGGPFVMGARPSDAAEILDLIAAGDHDALAARFPLPGDNVEG